MTAELKLDEARILVMDDDPVLRRVLGRTLTEWGAAVEGVENGARAIVELKQARDSGKPFRLAFLDTTLSGVNGFEVAQRIQEQHPDELGKLVLLLGEGLGASSTRREARVQEERGRTLGVGACLSKPLTRPALVDAIATILGPAVRTDGAVAQAPRTRVLLAEDSADTRSIVGHFLSVADYHIDAAENGKVALELFRLAAYDLVLMDIQMPVYDGYWAIERMRQWEQQQTQSRTPIVAVTAYAMTETAQKCLRAGFDGYLTKPVSRDHLLSTVRRYVRRPAP